MARNADYGMALETTRNFCKAAGNTEAWGEALEQLKNDLSAKVVQIVFICTRNKRQLMSLDAGESEAPLLQWLGMNEASIREAVPLTETSDSYQNIKLRFSGLDREWNEHFPISRDAVGPANIDYAFVCSTGFSDSNIVAMLGVCRDKQQGDFTAEDLQQLELVRDVLYNTFYLFSKNHVQNSLNQSLKGIIDRARFGFMVVDSVGHLMVSNDKAKCLLEQDDLFDMCAKGNITLKDPDLQSQFSHYLTSEIRGNTSPIAFQYSEELFMRIDPAADQNGYLLMASPIEIEGYLHQDPDQSNRKVAQIQIIDLGEKWQLDAQILQRVLDITAAEAEVLKYLSEGMQPRDIAEMKQRSYHTIRNHLQKVMNKTGMHRQADLISLVYSIVLAGAAKSEEQLRSHSV